MKKLLVLGFLSVLLLAFASSCDKCDRNEKKAVKIQKKIMKALVKNDYESAHQDLSALLLLDDCRVEDRKEASVREVFLAEIRYLISKNDEASWNRAQMLPMEVPNGFEKIQMELYQAIYDYALAFGKEEIKERMRKLQGDRMLVPISTLISGPLGEFFEVVEAKDGYKMIVNEGEDKWEWRFTVEIKRIKAGKVVKSGKSIDQHRLQVSFLDEDNAVIVDGVNDYFAGEQGDVVKVGESVFVTFSRGYRLWYSSDRKENLPLLRRIKTVSKFIIESY